MTVFDALLIAILLVSIFFAAIRGAMRELGTLLALILGCVLAWMFGGALLSGLGQEGSFFGTIIIYGALITLGFIGFFIGITLLMRKVTLSPRMTMADRVGGGVFGAVRALALIGLGFLGYGYYLDESNRPPAVNNALLLPLAAGSASIIEAITPGNPLGDDEPEELITDTNEDGYGRGDRSGLEELVTTVTTADGTSESRAEAARQQDDIADFLSETAKNDPDGE